MTSKTKKTKRTHDEKGNPYRRKFNGITYVLIGHEPRKRTTAEKFVKNNLNKAGYEGRIIKNPHGSGYLIYRYPDD
jgi:hypothetical protein